MAALVIAGPAEGGALLCSRVPCSVSGYILTDLTPDFGDQPAYTKTDLRLTYPTANGQFRIQAFVNNVEDQAVITRAVYGNHRSLLTSFAQPRTYGAAAGVRF